MQTPTKSKKIKKNSVAVDFQSVSLSSLKKYRRQYHIRVKPTAPKAELAAAISEHFASIPVPGEEEAISGFLQAVQKNRQTRLAEESELSAQEEQKFTENTSAASPVKGKSKKQVEQVQASPAIKNASQSNAKKVSKREKARS